MGAEKDKGTLIGIKGWLILPAALLVFSFLRSSLDIAHRLSFLGLFTFQYAGVGKIVLFGAFVKLLRFLHFLFTVGIVWLFFRKNKVLPKAYIAYLWLSFSFLLTLLIVWDIIYYKEIVLTGLLVQIIVVGIPLIMSLIGTLYFTKSRRVINTFTNKISRPDIVFAVVFVLIIILTFIGPWIMRKNDSVSKSAANLVYKYQLLELKFVEDDAEKVKQATDGNLLAGYDFVDVSADQGNKVLLKKDAAMVFDTYLEEAGYKFENNWPIIEIALDREGAKEFSKLTKDNIGKRLAIIFNGKVLYAPKIIEPIVDGRMVISGAFSPDEMKELTETLNFVIKNRSKQ